jgi:hypothetical protein
MTRRSARHLSLLGLAGLLAAVAAPATFAKEGGIARLDAPIPIDAAPGSAITVGWAAVILDGTVEHPIQGSPLFIRLLSPGGVATEERGVEDPPGSGHYVAMVVVPVDGIAGYEIGMTGRSCRGSDCVRSDWMLVIADGLSGYPASAATVAATGAGTAAGADGPSGPGGTATAPASEPIVPLPLVIAALAAAAAVVVIGLASLRRSRAQPAHS